MGRSAYCLLPVTTNTGKPSARGLAQEQGFTLASQGQGLATTSQGQGLATTAQGQGLATTSQEQGQDLSAQGHGLVVPMDLANAQHFMEGLVQVTYPSQIPAFQMLHPSLFHFSFPILSPTSLIHSLIHSFIHYPSLPILSTYMFSLV